MGNNKLVYVLSHLGLSPLAMVVPNKIDGTVTECQKCEFLREFVKKDRTPVDVTSLDSTDQSKMMFHWMVDTVPPQTKRKLLDVFQWS